VLYKFVLRINVLLFSFFKVNEVVFGSSFKFSFMFFSNCSLFIILFSPSLLISSFSMLNFLFLSKIKVDELEDLIDNFLPSFSDE